MGYIIKKWYCKNTGAKTQAQTPMLTAEHMIVATVSLCNIGWLAKTLESCMPAFILGNVPQGSCPRANQVCGHSMYGGTWHLKLTVAELKLSA